MKILGKLKAVPFCKDKEEEHIFSGTFNNKEVIIKKGHDEIVTEFEVLRKTDSKRLPRAYNIIAEDNYFYLVMEKIPGISLKNKINLNNNWKSKPLDQETAISLTLEISRCFKDLHHAGYLYKELTTDKVIITPDSELKLTGFSKCISADSEGHFRNNTTSAIWQTMSPEEFIQGTGLSYSSNVFSLGTILFQLVFGYSPFDVKRFYHDHDEWTLKNQFDLHIHFSRDFIDNLSASGELKKVIKKALTADRTKRFQTMEEFEKAMEELIMNDGL